MNTSGNKLRLAARIGPFVLVLALAGCDGMKPYDPPNERENGPEKGIFSGPDGEFVIG